MNFLRHKMQGRPLAPFRESAKLRSAYCKAELVAVGAVPSNE
jgi:hypothetical protein